MNDNYRSEKWLCERETNRAFAKTKPICSIVLVVCP